MKFKGYEVGESSIICFEGGIERTHIDTWDFVEWASRVLYGEELTSQTEEKIRDLIHSQDHLDHRQILIMLERFHLDSQKPQGEYPSVIPYLAKIPQVCYSNEALTEWASQELRAAYEAGIAETNKIIKP